MRTYVHLQNDALKRAAATLQKVATRSRHRANRRTPLRRAVKRVCAGRNGLLIEPPVRIELTTARLQGECSTTELRRPSNPTRLSGQFSASMTRCERTEVDDRLGRQPGIGMRSAIVLRGVTT